MKITIFSPYPRDTAPSQRFRYEHYLPYLEKSGIEYDYFSFYDISTWIRLYSKGNIILKIWGIFKSYMRRWMHLSVSIKSDYIFIHREITPLGPPIFEWILTKIFKKKIIYDFDDAIWLNNTSVQNKFAARLKWHGKVKKICRWAYKISCGNEFLSDFAKKYNKNVEVIPTVVNTEHVHFYQSKLKSDKKILGWTGSHSTLKYLNQLIPVLQELEEKYSTETRVIADKNPKLPLKNFRYVPWKKETEIEDLRKIDIGLMPLTDDLWSKGKCGFKAIQYLALGIPAVVSPAGVNAQIVLDEKFGYLAKSKDDWYNFLSKLIENEELRIKMGKQGRNHIVSYYSVNATIASFVNLFS